MQKSIAARIGTTRVRGSGFVSAVARWTGLVLACSWCVARAGSGGPGDSEAMLLLDLLERKGILTRQEAEQARTELASRRTVSLEEFARQSKVQFSRWVDRVDFSGDARLRFEHRSGENGQAGGGDRLEMNRWRYRLRAGAQIEFSEQLRAGVQFQSGTSGRSGNVTFGGDSGPWGRGDDGVYLNQLYLRWTPVSWFGATAGRQPNPFQVTSLVWDPDLQPEGLSETFRYARGGWEWTVTLGQFLYDEAPRDNPFGGGPAEADAYLFMQQVGLRYRFHANWSAAVSPLLHVYSGGGDSFRGPFVGTTPANSVGINDLMVLEVPWELRYSGGPWPVRVYGDFAVNLQGQERARAAGTPRYEDEKYGWLAGVEVGSGRRKGEWRIRAAYQWSGLYALDPNLVDTDAFDSRVNMRGVIVEGTYLFTDFLQMNLTYAHGERNRKALPTGAVGDLGGTAGTAYLDDYRLFQADLNLRF
ncbi:putative porin [Limisphaera sp. VF-2]|jgi:hypothetical protein|uniref:putative porin n=1 Tax=Limisphaera sp. VF-2 TaxID=3400418 RepID=UPI001770D501